MKWGTSYGKQHDQHPKEKLAAFFDHMNLGSVRREFGGIIALVNGL